MIALRKDDSNQTPLPRADSGDAVAKTRHKHRFAYACARWGGLEAYFIDNSYGDSKKALLDDGKTKHRIPIYDNVIRSGPPRWYFRIFAEDRFNTESGIDKLLRISPIPIYDWTDPNDWYVRVNSPMTIKGGDGVLFPNHATASE